jgi:hypothetical protein
MNPKTRTKCKEVLLNDAEEVTLDLICRLTGMSASPLFRHLLNKEARAQLTGNPPVRESRPCPGIGRACNRAARPASMRRNV